MPDNAGPSNHRAILPMFSPISAKPDKRYRTIVADPPWAMPLGPTLTQKAVKPALEYPTMAYDELMGLPVGMWAADQAHLYLWVPNSITDKAYEIARSWGFKPSTLIHWIKRRDCHDGWMGLGRYYRITTENILFAVRGGLELKRKDLPNLFYAPRGGHSEKPSTFYDNVERASHGPYLDVFARKQRMGWDTFGDEAFNFGTELPPAAFVGASDGP